MSAPLAGVKVCCSLRSSYPMKNARTIKVAEALSDAGADVTVLYVAPAGTDIPSSEKFTSTLVPEFVIPPSRNPVWLLRVAYNILVVRWLGGLLTLPRRYGHDPHLAKAMTRERADVYHAYVLDTAVPAMRVARKTGAKIIYSVRDFYVDSRKSMLTKRQIAYWDRAEHRVSREADLVIAVSEPMAVLSRDVYGAVRTLVIYNGPWECTQVAEPPHTPARLFFQGHFEPDRNLDTLIRAMAKLRGRATLTLQGWGDWEIELRELVEALGLSDTVKFVAPCEPTEVVQCGRAYDVGVMCHRGSTPNHDIAVPNKLMDYMGAGLALAASDLSGARSIIEHYHCGETIDPTDEDTMARDIARIIDSPERLAELKAASAAAGQDLRWDRQAERLVAEYVSVLGRAGGR